MTNDFPADSNPPQRPGSAAQPPSGMPPSSQPPAAPPGFSPPSAAPLGFPPPQGAPAAPSAPIAAGEPSLFDPSGAGTIAPPTEVVKKSSTGMRIGFAGALVAVVGLGGFAVNTALSEPAGPQTPEEAAADFFEAMGNEDIIGMVEVWLPSEREAYIDPSLALVEELERLEIFGEDIEIDTLGTLDIVVEGAEFTSSPLAPGFAYVTPTGGTVSVVGTSDDVPIVKVVKDWLEEEPEDYASTESIVADRDEVEYVVAVEHEGSWYLSLGYTVAEEVRADTDKPLPPFGQGPTPIGGATPEEAVANFAAELVEFDLEGMLTQLDPSEMRVLYDYSPLFLDDGQAAVDELLDELREAGAAWDITDLDLRTEDRRGRKVVILEGFTFSGSIEGNTASIDFRDKCVSIKTNGSDVGELDESFCEGDELEQLDEFGDLPEFFESMQNLEFETAGVTVVERDGRWYISTVPTVLYAYVDVLAALEPTDVDAMKDDFAELRDFFEDGPYDPGMFFGDPYDEGEWVPVEDAIGTGDDDYDYENDQLEHEEALAQEEREQELIDQEEQYQNEQLSLVQPHPSWIPAGYEYFAEDPLSWFLTDGLIVPDSAFSVMDVDTFDFASVAEYPNERAAEAALQRALDEGYLTDTEDYLTLKMSGRFMVIMFASADEPSAVFDDTVAHLTDK